MVRPGVRRGLLVLCVTAGAAVSWATAQQAAPVASHATAAASASPAAKATGTAAAAASKPAVAGSGAKVATKGIPKGIDKPYWSDLNPAQQEALMPLAAEWDKQPRLPKKKWVDIANRFHTLTPDEQQRVHERMRDWIKLTPAQRTLARENYTRAKKIGVATRSEQWKQYQQLPEAQKRKLAAQEVAKKHLPIINSGNKGELPPLPPIKPGVILPPPMVQPTPAEPAPIPPPSSVVKPVEEDQRAISVGTAAPPNVR